MAIFDFFDSLSLIYSTLFLFLLLLFYELSRMEFIFRRGGQKCHLPAKLIPY